METPLPKIDFGDINKFEASVGFFLVVLCGTSFYFDFNNEKINIWFKIVVGVIGLIVLLWGLWKWRKRQRNLDELLQLEVVEKERMVAASEKDMKEKMDKEFAESQDSSNEKNSVSDEATHEQSLNVKEYMFKCREIESTILSQLSTLSNYSPLCTQKVGPFVYDMVLKSNNSIIDDKIVEIKYLAGNSLTGRYLDQILHSLTLMLSIYKRDVKSNVKAILIIVYKDSTLDNDITRYKILERAAKDSKLYGLSVELIPESKIKDFNYTIFNI